MIICASTPVTKGYKRLVIGSRHSDPFDFTCGFDLTKEEVMSLIKVGEQLKKDFEEEDATETSTTSEL